MSDGADWVRRRGVAALKAALVRRDGRQLGGLDA